MPRLVFFGPPSHGRRSRQRAACRVAHAALAVSCLAAGAPGASASPASQQVAAQDLRRLSLEELMNIDVTLTARRAEPLATTPAAVTVVTGEDIRRAGVTTVADAVGLADSVHTARFNNGTWSITARGFNAVTANKMLVMVDGRTVYSPLFSGVFWNAVDYTLEDIDRIEVVRGPGATLWGANAVNGVINIVTRRAQDTAGLYLQGGTGNEDPGIVDVRFGDTVGATAYRIYAKYVARDAQVFSSGASAGDRRERQQSGFRIDRGGSGATLMFKGDLFFDREHLPDRPQAEFTVADVQARWTRPLSSRSALQFQSYLNHERRTVPLQLAHHLTTFDADVQHELATDRHSLVSGGGIRVNHDSTQSGPALALNPANRTYPVANAFVQDDVALVPARVFITPGIKVERNAFSGFEVQPGVRGRVMLPRQQMIWGSVARAVRRPTRFDEDIVVTAPNGQALILGNDDFSPERLIASDVGYRAQAGARLSADVSAFAHVYDRVRSQEAAASGAPVPIVIGNTLNGTSRGVELAVSVQPASWWRVHASYTEQRITITRDPGSRDISGGTTESNDPPRMFGLRTSIDLPHRVEFDLRLRSVAALPSPPVPAFTELSLRLGWSPTRVLELAVVGDDLLHDNHPEFNATARGYEEFERSVRLVAALRVR